MDILSIPTWVLEEMVLPHYLEQHPADREGSQPRSVANENAKLAPPQPVTREAEIRNESLEQLVENRFINGTATMVIDLDLCTRCDACLPVCPTNAILAGSRD